MIARSLVAALRGGGHEADLVVTPQNRFGRQAAAYLATWLTDVGRTHDDRPIDQVISLRYPSYAVRHPRHVCWLLHPMREYYDRWEAFSRPLSWKGRLKENARRRTVWALDRYLLAHRLSKLFVISATVQRRLETFGGIRSEVLHPPAPQRAYRVDDYEPYLFAVSRFTPLKRMTLIVEALAQPEAADIRAVLAGDGESFDEVSRLVRERGLAGRVSLPGRLDEAALVDHLARCRAVVFPPFDEDYGFVTVEAFASAKASDHLHGQRRADRAGAGRRLRAGERADTCSPGARVSPCHRISRSCRASGCGREGRGRAPDMARDSGPAAPSGKLIAHASRFTALGRVAVSTIAVITSSPLLVEGGHLIIARSLVAALSAQGHEADLVVTPQNRFGRQAAAYLATWLTDVGRTHDDRPIDQVISLRYPSYAVRHERHVCWLNHTMREYYDLWDRFSATLSPLKRVKEHARRRAIHAADRHLLTKNVSALFVQSETIRRRYAAWPELRAEVLYPPAPPRPYRVDDYEPYLLAVSRFTPLKRMHLIVEALAQPAAAGIRAVLAGDGEAFAEVQRLVAERGLADRVSLPGRLDDAQLVDHLARCRAVVFPPLDEDYGFVTVEAFSAARPVVTCTDSGGPAELVVDGTSGYVVEATPAALAAAFRRLVDDRDLAARLGQAGLAVASRLTWRETVRKLVIV